MFPEEETNYTMPSPRAYHEIMGKCLHTDNVSSAGYLMIEGRCSDEEVVLSKDNLMSMIDIALDSNDTEWVKELSERLVIQQKVTKHIELEGGIWIRIEE